jgi:hypothetical protein
MISRDMCLSEIVVNIEQFNDLPRSCSECVSEERFAFAVHLRREHGDCYFLASGFDLLNGFKQLLVGIHENDEKDCSRVA